MAVRTTTAGSVCALPSSTLCNFEPCHLLSVQISNGYYGKIRVSNIKLVKEFGCLWHPNFVGIKLYYSNFVTAGNPVFKRGGNYNNGDQAGVFTFNNNGKGTKYIAPASSKVFFRDSASSLDKPSLTVLGAPSTMSLASFKPKPHASLTALTT